MPWGKSAHVPELLKLACTRVRVLQREATAVGNPALQPEGIPHSPQLEQACVQQQRPSAAKSQIKDKEIMALAVSQLSGVAPTSMQVLNS